MEFINTYTLSGNLSYILNIMSLGFILEIYLEKLFRKHVWFSSAFYISRKLPQATPNHHNHAYISRVGESRGTQVGQSFSERLVSSSHPPCRTYDCYDGREICEMSGGERNLSWNLVLYNSDNPGRLRNQ